jgi:hypothetical protein
VHAVPHACFRPPVEVAIHRLPRWELVREHAPAGAATQL